MIKVGQVRLTKAPVDFAHCELGQMRFPPCICSLTMNTLEHRGQVKAALFPSQSLPCPSLLGSGSRPFFTSLLLPLVVLPLSSPYASLLASNKRSVVGLANLIVCINCLGGCG